MKKHLNYIPLLLLICASVHLTAQTVPRGIKYQAVLLDDLGKPLPNQWVDLRVKLLAVQDGKDKVYFAENHRAETADNGQFEINIGEDNTKQDIINRVPWSTEDIWLVIEKLEKSGSFKELMRGTFTAVPYAYHAEYAEQLIPNSEDISLRDDQSIRWNISGNAKTVPDAHFLGTVDEKSLFFKTRNETRMVIGSNGQLTLYASPDLTTEDDKPSSYPMAIFGGGQGIYIQLKENANSKNNYLTFADLTDIHGAVEGETASEYLSSFRYIWFAATQTVDIILAGVEGVAGGIETAGIAAAANPAAAAAGSRLLTFIKKAAFKSISLVKVTTQSLRNMGVYFQSGAADYAEWLERNPNDLPMMPGEIVALKDGQITRNTQLANQLFVVSKNPAFLGNLPEDQDKGLYEKIAMMGQVNALVAGQVNIGDYILPSGKNDGIARAVGPQDMQSGDYAQIIGVAWAQSTNGPISNINVAVGINSNDLAGKISDIEAKIEHITQYLEGKTALNTEQFQQKERDGFAPTASKTNGNQLQLTDAQFDAFIDKHADQYNAIYAEGKRMLDAEGIDLAPYPFLQAMFDDPTSYMKSLRRNPKLRQVMAGLDEALITAGLVD